MSPLDLASTYLEIFCAGGDPEALREILAEDLRFEGPLFRFDSAAEYLAALREDPPLESRYDLLGSFERGSVACLVYRFSKPGLEAPMAQLFETRDGKISRILLIFDSAPFVAGG